MADLLSMTYRLAFFIYSVLFCATVMAQVRATTDDGRHIIIYDNGTWKPLSDTLSAPLSMYTKPETATASVNGKEVLYRQYFDPAKWQADLTSINDIKEYAFSLKEDFVFGMVVPERVQMDMALLRAAVMDNAVSASKDMRIIAEEACMVNGNYAEKVIMKGTVDGKPFTYYCLYYTGSRGVVQVITYCNSNIFERHKSTMAAFLHGFTLIND